MNLTLWTTRTTSPDEYNARHIVLRLKENRFNLPEYSEYKGLLCEIQLTTVLFHAWAEIQHDIIYKPNKELLEFDKPAFDNINNYFKEIMEKYLKKLVEVSVLFFMNSIK